MENEKLTLQLTSDENNRFVKVSENDVLYRVTSGEAYAYVESLTCEVLSVSAQNVLTGVFKREFVAGDFEGWEIDSRGYKHQPLFGNLEAVFKEKETALLYGRNEISRQLVRLQDSYNNMKSAMGL